MEHQRIGPEEIMPVVQRTLDGAFVAISQPTRDIKGAIWLAIGEYLTGDCEAVGAIDCDGNLHPINSHGFMLEESRKKFAATMNRYFTTEEAAKELGVSRARVLEILRQDPSRKMPRLPGATKHGRDWMIPREAVGGFRRLSPGKQRGTTPENEERSRG